MNWSVIGFERYKNYFSRLIRENELAHAYLLTGPEAIGKKQFALDIAAGACAPHDSTLVAPQEDGSTISIDQIRSLGMFLATTSLAGRRKCVIIDDAHRMTDEAANALLKSIEEPHRSIVWMLVSHQPDILPATIRSRCQQVRLLPQGNETVAQLAEVKKLPTKDRELVTLLAQGRVGYALRMVTGDVVGDARQTIAQFEKLPQLSVLERLAYARKLHQEEASARVASWWLAWTYAHLGESSSAPIAKKLLALIPTLQQPQFNHRLAMENFLLGL